MPAHRWDVAVVGAGAAGLWAALECARRGRRTVLLEKNLRPGLKILISGGGRCNLTTTRRGRDLESQYGKRRGRWLAPSLRAFPPGALIQAIEAAGVALREEDLEKIFPVSGRARDVLDALLRLNDEAGVELRLGTPLRGVRAETPGAPGFVLDTDAAELRADSLVLATGGLSYPKTGATGDGYGFAEVFGHSITPRFPALAPLLLDDPWVRGLQGLVLDARLRLVGPQGERLLSRRRPTLFTHLGLSGPGPMDLAGDVEEADGACTVRLDLLPDQNREQTEEQLLAACAAQGKRQVQQLLPGALPERMRRALAERADVETVVGAALARPARRRLVEALHGLELSVAESRGFDHAEVTRGGVALDEVDPKTCRSRLQPGLFLIGELLDVDGPIGGFNFQAAFATAHAAGLVA